MTTHTNSPERDFDLLVYGASGFTGRRVTRELYQQVASGRESFSYAIGGRNRARLESVIKELRTIPISSAKSSSSSNKSQIVPSLPTILTIVHTNQFDAMTALTARTRILISTAGPYATQDGETVIAACISTHTHYLDLTGETVWLRRMIEKYESEAKSRGVCILNMCGFDSIPADIGCTALVDSFSQLSLQHVEGSIRLNGQAASGGSMASIIAFYQQTKEEQEEAWNPFLLNPTTASSRTSISSSSPPPPLQSYHNSADRHFPWYDSLSHSYAVPLNMMHLINTRAIRRSIAQHDSAGDPGWKFTYNEHIAFPSLVGAWLFWFGITIFAFLLQFNLFRKVVARFGPQPGTGQRHKGQSRIFILSAMYSFDRPYFSLPSGPSDTILSSNSFEYRLIGVSTDGDTHCVCISGGDPGYVESSKLIAACSLLLLNRCRGSSTNQLHPSSTPTGFISPALVFGTELMTRMGELGMPVITTTADPNERLKTE